MKDTGVTGRVALCCSGGGLRTAIATALRDDGWEVTACDCPADDAVGELHAAEPNVIIVETHARDPEGLELCQAIRADSALARARLLVLQDGGREIDRRRAAALGAHGILAMPFGIESLRAELGRLRADA